MSLFGLINIHWVSMWNRYQQNKHGEDREVWRLVRGEYKNNNVVRYQTICVNKEVYKKSYVSKEKEAAHPIVEVTEVGVNLNKKMGCQKDMEGNCRSDKFKEKYEGMKANKIYNKRVVVQYNSNSKTVLKYEPR